MKLFLSPQDQIKQLVSDMYPGRDIVVKGRRNPPRGGKKYPYRASLVIDGKTIFTVEERNWRTAYKTLQIIISKELIS
jgi:hypothetical protein